ncbi:Acetate kinase [Candidatus Ecksteinia adelgidicola]|nr:Acetate kinase [Candidatus Ecksteinia adelgidicola]
MSNQLVLVLNCGSSSLKFSVINITTCKESLSGLAECFYLPEARIQWKENGIKSQANLARKSAHSEALYFIVNTILKKNSILSSKLIAIGHRIVHGGKRFTASTIINDTVIQGIKDATIFAPLHNPAHLIGITAAFKAFPELITKNVAVFDTAFHQTMPEESYLYALPYSLYRDYGVRRYGAHGISHFYIAKKAAKKLNKSLTKVNIITCHLGNGSSITAIRNGQCVDTSMGLTPLEGLVMGTRSGDIDPGIIFYLYESIGMSIKKIKKILTNKSGLLGLSGETSDFRYLEDNYNIKKDAKRAIDIFCHRLSKYISAYSVLMNGRLDAVIFTGGIGENSSIVRELILNKLSLLNFKIDYERNMLIRFGKSGVITKDNSRLALVIPTNEALVIAQDTFRLVI